MTAITAMLFLGAAQGAPFDLAHQGRVLDTTGGPLVGSHTLHLRLYDAGIEVWDHDYGAVPMDGGYYNVTLTGVDSEWFDGDVTIGVTVDSTDPADELSPRQTLVAVPRATLADMALRVRMVATPTGSCVLGELVYDTDVGALRTCTIGIWNVGISQETGYRRWADESHAASCDGYRNPTNGFQYTGATGDGVYRVDPGGLGPIDVWCDMTRHDGGWTHVLTLDTNDGTTRDYFDTVFWTGAGVVGSIAAHYVADFKSEAFDRAPASELLILAHNEGVALGTAVYGVVPLYQGESIRWMFTNLADTTVTGPRLDGTGAVGDHGYARNAGDTFVDQGLPIIINSRFSPVDSDNYTRMGSDYSSLCGIVSCNGHNLGGLGGRHSRTSWGAYYEGAALLGYCPSQGWYGTDGRGFNTDNAFGQASCSPLRDNVDFAIFVR